MNCPVRVRFLVCAVAAGLGLQSAWAADMLSAPRADADYARPVPLFDTPAQTFAVVPATWMEVAPVRTDLTSPPEARVLRSISETIATIQPAAPPQAPPPPVAPPPAVATSAPGVPAPGTATPATATPATGTEAAPAMAVMQADDEDLWARIRRGFKMPDLDTWRARQTTRWYADKPQYIERISTRASMYLYHIVAEVEKRGMPTEIALLPFIESGMQPNAVSIAKAAGLWQFIPSTGTKYALEQNMWKDERFGVIESTRAALDYLQKLYGEFGDWQLALAAYNYGELGVERAIANARRHHRSTAYKDLRLPHETEFYVPKLQAIKNIIADPQRYGITLPEIPDRPYFVSEDIPADMDVATAARLAEIPIDEFQALNPAFNRPLIIGASSPTILLPADHAEAFETNLVAVEATGQPMASWTAHVMRRGETLEILAQKANLSVNELRRVNRIPWRYRPAAGSVILVPRGEAVTNDISPKLVDASFSLVPVVPRMRRISYRVHHGDTLSSIAHHWHVRTHDIMAWNQLHSSRLRVGQRLALNVWNGGNPRQRVRYSRHHPLHHYSHHHHRRHRQARHPCRSCLASAS